MDMSTAVIVALVAVATLLLNVVIAVKGGAWGLSDRLAAMESRLANTMAAHRTEIDSAFETMRRETGETAAALRTKIHEIETWARDEFVRKNSFENALSRIEKSVDRLSEKLDEFRQS